MHVCKVFDSFGINPGGLENQPVVDLNQTGDIWKDATAWYMKTLAASESSVIVTLAEWL